MLSQLFLAYKIVQGLFCDAVRTSGDDMSRCVVREPSDLFANVFHIMVKLVLNGD